jgi:hypothetical protein
MLLKAETRLKLKMISNRGVKVWPHGNKNTNKVNHWRCRFVREHPAIHVENSLYAGVNSTGDAFCRFSLPLRLTVRLVLLLQHL